MTHRGETCCLEFNITATNVLISPTTTAHFDFHHTRRGDHRSSAINNLINLSPLPCHSERSEAESNFFARNSCKKARDEIERNLRTIKASFFQNNSNSSQKVPQNQSQDPCRKGGKPSDIIASLNAPRVSTSLKMTHAANKHFNQTPPQRLISNSTIHGRGDHWSSAINFD